MIHQVTVTFYHTKPLVFYRTQDASKIIDHKSHQFFVSIDKDKLVFLTTQDNPICKLYLDPYVLQTKQDKALLFVHDKKHDKKIEILQFASSKRFIQQLNSKLSLRKYKSCLSFVPSQTQHISLLSGQSPTQRFRGFLNLAAVMFVVLNLRNILDNYRKYGTQFHRTPTDFIPISVVIGLICLFVFPCVAYYIQKLKFQHLVHHKLASNLLNLNICLVFVYNILFCRKYQPNVIAGIGFTMLCLVMVLKLISYKQVNAELFQIIRRLNKLQQLQFNEYMFANHEISQNNLILIKENKHNQQELLNFSKLMYFLAAPTLCYQLSYPRTSSIRWSWLLKRVVQLIFMSTLMLVIWLQYIETELQKWLTIMDSDKYTYLQVFYRLLRLSIPNTIIWIAGFYNLFHVTLNISGELLRFADRKFYQDWWNCRTVEQYWKLWNLPVHFWFIRHMYNPLLQRRYSKITASLLVFLVSAVAHQFVVSVPLGIVSYYAFLAMLLQAPVIIIQRKVDKILHLQNSQLGNVSFWIFFCILGQPVTVFIYYSLYMVKNHSQALQNSGSV